MIFIKIKLIFLPTIVLIYSNLSNEAEGNAGLLLMPAGDGQLLQSASRP